MWVIQFNVLRGGERSPEDGAPREFLDRDSPFPLPDIDQTVLHRGEAFVVDDVIWDLERKTVTVELVPPDEAEVESGKPVAGPAPADDSDEDSENWGADGEEEADFDVDLDPQGGEGEPEVPEVLPEEQPAPKVRHVRGPAGPQRGQPDPPGKTTRRGEA